MKGLHHMHGKSNQYNELSEGAGGCQVLLPRGILELPVEP